MPRKRKKKRPWEDDAVRDMTPVKGRAARRQ